MENKNLNKIGFDTELEAHSEIERILLTQKKPWKKEDIKPCRCYFDSELNKWFLTSKITIVEYKK
jgi:hypothetical protein